MINPPRLESKPKRLLDLYGVRTLACRSYFFEDPVYDQLVTLVSKIDNRCGYSIRTFIGIAIYD